MVVLKSVSCFLFVAAFLSCSKGSSAGGTVPEESLVRLSADLLVAESTAQLLGEDSAGLNLRRDSLYRHYQTTPAGAESSLAPYRSALPRWKDFQTKVMQELERRQHTAPAAR